MSTNAPKITKFDLTEGKIRGNYKSIYNSYPPIIGPNGPIRQPLSPFLKKEYHIRNKIIINIDIKGKI